MRDKMSIVIELQLFVCDMTIKDKAISRIGYKMLQIIKYEHFCAHDYNHF